MYIDLFGRQAVKEWDSLEDIPSGSDYIEYEGRYLNDDPDVWEDSHGAYENYSEFGEQKTMERGWLADKWNSISQAWNAVTVWREGEPTITVEDATESDGETNDPVLLSEKQKQQRKQWIREQLDEQGRDAFGEDIDNINEVAILKHRPLKLYIVYCIFLAGSRSAPPFLCFDH